MNISQIKKLIKMVRSYPQLYDLGHPEYGNPHKRDAVWTLIGNKMNVPAQFCRAKWTILRSGYRKATRNTADSHRKKWRFEQDMGFLKRFLQPQNHRLESREGFANTWHLDDDAFTVEVKEECEAFEDDVTTSYDPMPIPNVVKLAEEQKSHMHQEKERKEDRKEERDGVTHFFLSMAETVKSLPPLKQAEIKAQVFNCISAAEIKRLEEKDVVYT